jgi:arylformamidase
MLERNVIDWDDAYANGVNIPHGERWPDIWVEPARSFRERLLLVGRAQLEVAYAGGARNHLDLFLPEGPVKGLVVFIHGGFWMALDKSFWSHLAAGPLEHGYATAIPSYTLCPEIRLAGIVKEIGAAIEKAASMVQGPLLLTGHSAGGQLASRMITASAPLTQKTRGRIRNVVSISGLHDLRPLMNARMNQTLRIDEEEALAESPALLRPSAEARITCWVGGAEREEFKRQNKLLANIWTGLGATTSAVTEPDRHHFDVIDGLMDPKHPLTTTLLN